MSRVRFLVNTTLPAPTKTTRMKKTSYWWPPEPRLRALPLRTTGKHPGDQGTLGKEENDEDRRDRQECRYCQFGPEDRALGDRHSRVERGRIGYEVLQADRKRVLPVVVEHHVGEEEIGPVGNEGKEADEGHYGPSQWQSNPAEDPPLAATVDPGRAQELFRDRRREENVGKVDPEREETKREYHRPSRVLELEEVHLQEKREHQSAGGHDRS